MISKVSSSLVVLTMSAVAQGEWKFVRPEANAHVEPRAVALTDKAPSDLKESVKYEGSRQRYAQLRFGSAGTTRIAVVVDDRTDGGVDLYVDANRDRNIKPDDRVAGRGSKWVLDLELAIADGDAVDYSSRPVRLDLHRHVLAWAPLGFVEGRVQIGEKMALVRRFDTNGNGIYSDARDRISIDADGDGRFDAYSEVFLYRSVLELGGVRWMLRESEAGDGLTLAKLEGEGEICLAADKKRKFRTLIVTLQSDEGVTVALDMANPKVKTPIGTYRVVGIEAKVEAAGSPWGYIFTLEKSKRSHVVSKGGSVEIDPFSSFVFDVGAESTTVKAGETLGLQPRWLTADGLLINTCWRGTQSSFGFGGPNATIKLTNEAGAVVDTASSGFA